MASHGAVAHLLWPEGVLENIKSSQHAEVSTFSLVGQSIYILYLCGHLISLFLGAHINILQWAHHFVQGHCCKCLITRYNKRVSGPKKELEFSLSHKPQFEGEGSHILLSNACCQSLKATSRIFLPAH